jgi:N-acetylmuramoyl-L-alanine amidase CwlA
MVSVQLIDNNRPKRKLKELRGIVIHWTANVAKGANAQAHFKYFGNTYRGASAHYFVDSIQTVQLIPDDEVAWHVGDKIRTSNLPVRAKYVPKGGSPNDYFIGIEMCVNVDSDAQTVIDSTILLTSQLMMKYNLTKDQVVRHFDLTGKDCPKMFLPQVINGVTLDHAWLAFKSLLPTTPPSSMKLSSSTLELNTWEKVQLALRQSWDVIRKM